MVLHIIWVDRPCSRSRRWSRCAKPSGPGRQPMGWIATAGLGIVGAYVGNTRAAPLPAAPFYIHPPIKHSFLGALVGAVVLLRGYSSLSPHVP